MSTSANNINDCVGNGSASQPATGASNLLLPSNNTAARNTTGQWGNDERSHENTSLPISDGEPSGSVASANTKRARRSITCTDGEPSGIEANTNSKRTRRESDAPCDEEPSRAEANTISSSARRSAITPDEEPRTVEANTISTRDRRRSSTLPDGEPSRNEANNISTSTRRRSATPPDEEPRRVEVNTISTRVRRRNSTLPDEEPSRSEDNTISTSARRRSATPPDEEPRRVEANTISTRLRRRRSRVPDGEPSDANTISTRVRRSDTLPDGEPSRIEAGTNSIRARMRSSTLPDGEPSRSEANSTRERRRSITHPGEEPRSEANTISTRGRRRSGTLPDGEPRRNEAGTNSISARRGSSTRPDGEPRRSEAGTNSTRARRRSVTHPGDEPSRSTSTRAMRFARHDNNGVEGGHNKPLLSNLESHPSANSRAGDGPSLRNLNLRGAWPRAHALYLGANDGYKQLFVRAGFGAFLRIQPITLPQAYTLALMERWFSDTNTLHLPCGEIGPTPVDWTMVTSLCFQGLTITFSRRFTMDRALELLGAGRGAISEGKIKLSAITPSAAEVRAMPPSNEARDVVFRRLFLYVIASCFFGNNRSVINHELVECLENVNEVRRYNWGAITYAAFLHGMRRKVSGETGAFTAFWQFLPLWAFEYLNISRPMCTEEDVFPRAMRWNCPRGDQEIDQNFPELIGARCQLDYVEEAHVDWQPYLHSADFHLDSMESAKSLAKRRVPFHSIKTWEYYLGERCRRQLGLPCRVPLPPPEQMYGTYRDVPADVVGVGRSAVTLVMDDTVEYAQWFAANSIGRIANVNRCIGGPEIGLKVINNWMATYQPDLIVISRSEYKELKEARDENMALRMALNLEREDPVEREDPAEPVNNNPEQGINDQNPMQNDSQEHDR